MKPFSLSRVLRCTKWMIVQDRSYLLSMVLVTIFVIAILVLPFSTDNDQVMKTIFKLKYCSIYVFFCFFINLLYTSEKPNRRLRMLMMPFSNSEKYFTHIIIYVLGGILIIIASEMVVDLARWSYCSFMGLKADWLTPLFFREMVDNTFNFWEGPSQAFHTSLLLFLTSLCLTISVLFRKISFLVGILCIGLIFLIIGQIDDMEKTLSIILLLLTVPVAAASYHIFCKIQYITRKWLQI